VKYRPGPDPALVRAAGEVINAAERPLILGGSGVALSDCDDELRKFIDTVGAPFMLIGTGRGAVPDDHPLSLWDGGLFGLLMGMGQSDVVIALGIRFNWLLQFGQFFPQAKLVRVDIDPAEIDRNRRADVGLVGDLGLTLAELNQVVTQQDHTAWRQELTEGYEAFVVAEIDSRNEPSDPIHPARMVAQVREVVGDDAVYVIDGGDTSYFGLVGLSAKRRSSVYSAAGGQFGCLGTGIPFALAAKAARPDETVVVISGDGSMGFNIMEFDTAVRHNLPFVCVVNNDQAWGMIKHGQEICYGEQRLIGSELGRVHYEKVAEALGGYGEFVEKDEDIAPAVKRALASGKPACVNVMTDPCVTSPATLQFADSLNME